MLNFMVCNFRGTHKNDNKRLQRLLNAQIENSLELGWKPEEIKVISNNDLEYQGVKTIKGELNEICLTGSKMFGLKWFVENFGLMILFGVMI